MAGSRHSTYDAAMACAFRNILALVLCAAALPAAAADPPVCLRQDQRRAAVATHHAIPLAHAVREIRSRVAGAEVVRARLCYRGAELVYVLTVLVRDGKVIRVSVNAASGAIVDRR
jgi:uncharacterized membrane protein YkoI